MSDLTITTYEANKQLMKDMPAMDFVIYNRQLVTIANSMINNSQYWMLQNRELNDVTVFNIINENNKELEDALDDTFKARGIVQDIRQLEDSNWEIWIKGDEESYVYYLFDYEQGIIEVY